MKINGKDVNEEDAVENQPYLDEENNSKLYEKASQ